MSFEVHKDFYRSLFANSADGILLTSPDGQIFAANPAACRMLGRTEEEICGLGRAGIIDTTDPRWVAAVPERGRTGSASSELTLIRADGSRFPAEVTSAVFEDGGLRRISLVMRDISEQRRAQEHLKLFRALLDNSSDAIEVIDPLSFHFYDVNETACQDLGYSREELLSMSVPDIDPSFSTDFVEKTMAQIRQQGSIQFESLHRRKDGSTFPVEISAKLIELDKPYGVTIVRDISKRKKEATELSQLNQILKTLTEVNRTLLRATDEIELMKDMCEVITENGGYSLAWIGLMQPDKSKSLQPVARSGKGQGYVDALTLTWNDLPNGQGPAGAAARTGKTQIVQDTRNDPRFKLWLASAAAYGLVSVVCLPLKRNEVPFGALCIYASEGEAFADDEVKLLEEVANDLAFGVVNLRTHVERDQAVEQRQHYIERLRTSLEEMLQAIAATIEMRDPYTAGHQRRVAGLAVAIAQKLGLSEEQVHGIQLAGIVHDLGKIGVPSEVLSKPGHLNEIEFAFIKTHPQAGYEILKEIEFPWPIAKTVLQHHERLNGSGYPRGLKGDAIILEARIMGVADTVEAMSSHRPYRPGMGVDVALAEISSNRGTLFDPQVVDACIALFRDEHYSFSD